MKALTKALAAFLVVIMLLTSLPFSGNYISLTGFNAAAASEESISCERHQLGDWTVTKEPSCSEEGSRYAICSTCNTTFTEILDKLPHKESEWIVAEDSTCLKKGLMQKVCTLCGEVLRAEIILEKDHVKSEWVTDFGATCTKPGARHIECKNCEEILERETIKTVPHIYGEDGTCINCGAGCDHMCHKGGLLWIIVQFFLKLLKINPVCVCGAAHY